MCFDLLEVQSCDSGQRHPGRWLEDVVIIIVSFLNVGVFSSTPGCRRSFHFVTQGWTREKYRSDIQTLIVFGVHWCVSFCFVYVCMAWRLMSLSPPFVFDSLQQWVWVVWVCMYVLPIPLADLSNSCFFCKSVVANTSWTKWVCLSIVYERLAY